MTITCYRCGKPIMGKARSVFPSNLALSLGDFVKSFHPICYGASEREAAKELSGGRKHV